MEIQNRDFPSEFVKPFLSSCSLLSRSEINFFENENRRQSCFRGFVTRLTSLVFFVSLLVNFFSTISSGKYIELIDSFPVVFIAIQSLFKAIVIIRKKTSIENIITQLAGAWRSNESLNEKQMRIKNDFLRQFNLFHTLYYWLNILGSWQYTMTPIFEVTIRRVVLQQEVDFSFPFGCSFPFDPTQSWLVYGAVYFFEVNSILSLAYCLIGGELLLLTFCGHLSYLFTLLKEDLLIVNPTINQLGDVAIYTDFPDYKNSNSDLKIVIETQQKLMKLTNIVDEVFNPIIFINLLFATITICFFGFIAQKANGANEQARNLVGMVATIVPIFNICYYGQKLIDASEGLAESVYFIPWYKGGATCRRLLGFVMFRSQKPCCMTSLRYTPITLNTFTTVLSRTWSYLSLLRSVFEDGEID